MTRPHLRIPKLSSWLAPLLVCGLALGQKSVLRITEPAPSISIYRKDIELGSTIDQIIMKCMEKDPINRFQSVSDLMFAVQSALPD